VSTRKNISRKEPSLASPEAAAAELRKMSKADLIRLEQFARFRAVGLPWLDWEDLLHEAIDRVLAGTRRWPVNLPFVVFMCGTIKSIASDWHKGRLSRKEISLSPSSDDADAELQIVDPHTDIETEVAARQTIAQIEKLFSGDAVALAILKGVAMGHSPEEIQGSQKISARQYSTAQKRIRRAIAGALSEDRL
jgi:DNA-directed RNA polymerase specialized sigma24 family protein